MFLYLIKSAACMAILLAFYKLLLEKEQMHVFKRFYLLAAVTASLLIPHLVFIEYVAPAVTSFEPTEFSTINMGTEEVPLPRDSDVMNWNLIVWNIYIIGLVGFGFRFLKNLFQIIKRIRTNPKLKQRFSIKVLLQETLPPHTFFRFVFLNKEKFENNDIPKEVILHEEVHARQLHSIDVILIELLHLIFWFNPFVFWFKRSIKLNHEFLADSAVLKAKVSRHNYQNTLLSYLSKESQSTYQSINMANAINYSSIKKRFKVMKTQTSKKQFALRVSLLLPLVALLVYGFSVNKVIEQAPPVIENSTTIEHIIELKLLDNQEIWHNDTQWKLEELAKNVVNLVPEGITVEQVVIEAETNVELNETFFENISSVLRELKIKHFQACYFETEDTMNSNEPLQQSASRKLMAEYNALAKKYNEMDSNRMRIRKSDVERLAYIYGLMSDKQKADAEPFPDFPEPPPVPNAPNPPNEREEASEKIKQIIKEQDPYDVVGANINVSKVRPNAPPATSVLNGEALNEKAAQLRATSEALNEESENLELQGKALKTQAKKLKEMTPASPKVLKGAVNNPPQPPTPVSPLDLVIEMAKNGATFYYEGKEISSDKAITLLKNNENLNIKTTRSNSKKPQVQISKNPIKIGGVSKKSKLLDYALELEKKNADFYYDNQPINSQKGIALIKSKKYASVETLPWVEKNPEVKIYSE